MKKKELKEDLCGAFSLSDYVQRVLDEDALKYEKHDEDSVYRMVICGETVGIDMIIQYSEEKEFICVYAFPEYKVPKDKLLPLLTKMNQLNMENPSACLRIDEEERVISAVAFINTDGGITNLLILKAAIKQCFNAIANNIDTLMEIIYDKDVASLMLSSFEKMEGDDHKISC